MATPARGRKSPLPRTLIRTGRLDALDSVARQSPSVIGFAFNNRLLLGGFAGEPDSAIGGLNPFGDPAQENLTLLLLDAHRMLTAQGKVLQGIPAFVKLFRDAFPEEAAMSDANHNLDLLINDETVFRATATFLRTTVTRSTPWDRFLSGVDDAMTPAQQRGAKLFFTAAKEGGAGCYSCHSGPMLNKQYNDPDVAGIGAFVEENFVNVGIGDHPLQALGRMARSDPNFHDEGRKEITQREEDAYKFRVVTLRQLKDARTFFHNGSFTKVRDVVSYFNAGMPQDRIAGAASTLSSRFTRPRGLDAPPGLGLTSDQVDDLTDFLENALYDPAFVKDDPNSSTRMFQPTERDLAYSKYRPDLAALGAKDGFVPSGLAIDNNDALSRRDQGLEFLDVNAQTLVERIRSNMEGARQTDEYRITNAGVSVVDTHLVIVVRGLSGQYRVENGSGFTRGGDQYVRVFLADGVLKPGQSITQTIRIRRLGGGVDSAPVSYSLDLMSGQGNP